MPNQLSRKVCSMFAWHKIVKRRHLVRRRKAIAITSIGKYIAIKIEETLEENDNMNRYGYDRIVEIDSGCILLLRKGETGKQKSQELEGLGTSSFEVNSTGNGWKKHENRGSHGSCSLRGRILSTTQ